MKILLVLSSLNQGGIERQISMLAPLLVQRGHKVTIVVSRPGGYYEEHLRSEGVDVLSATSLDNDAKFGRIGRVNRVARRLWFLSVLSWREKYDVAYGFGSSGNHYAVLAKIFGGSRVVWGIRNSLPFGTALNVRFNRALSAFVNLAISKSRAGLQLYERAHIQFPRTKVIANGIDTDRNRPCSQWREKIRKELGLSAADILVGSVGRLDQNKDHATFIRAAALVIKRLPEAHFLLVGRGINGLDTELRHLAGNLGVADRCHWLGSRGDVEFYLNAMDVFVSCSITEGFPNVIAEAMAVGLPCVVTPAGDSELIIADLGEVFPIGDEQALANSIVSSATEDKASSRRKRRERIVTHFSLQQFVDETECALEELTERDPTV